MSRIKLPGFTTLYERCIYDHDHVDRLFGVAPKPIKDLPQVCTCGAKITYAPMVMFCEYSDPIGALTVDVGVKFATWDACPIPVEVVKEKGVNEDGEPVTCLTFRPKVTLET